MSTPSGATATSGRGGIVASVAPGSIGDEIGLEPGDQIVSINGHVLRDVIDYRYYAAEEEILLVVERGGERHEIEIERDYGEELGITFCDLVFDGMRRCTNRCPFCFVRQMPGGHHRLRTSLYIRDDDYRYSFLLGNFCTLTNMTEEDWQRIGEQRLSPLYVSIHATIPEVRRRILGNPRAPEIMPQLQRLGRMGIRVHGQIVIWPEVNDGQVLRRSIEDLADLWPTVQTLALVPVGLTRYHRGPVRLMRPDEAGAVLDLATAYIPRLRKRTGKTWLYPSDELYLLAHRPVPDDTFYDDPAQLENGVGLLRRFLDDWEETKEGLDPTRFEADRITIVCGTLVAPYLERVASEFQAHTGIEVEMVPVMNRLFGETVTVSGLLAGVDVVEALAGRDLGDHLFLPRSMFDAEGQVTLDDLTPSMLEQRLGVPLTPVGTMREIAAILESRDGLAG